MPVSILIPNQTGFSSIFGLTPNGFGGNPSKVAVNSVKTQLDLANASISNSSMTDPVISTDKSKITWSRGDTSGYNASLTITGSKLDFTSVEHDTFSLTGISYKVMNGNSTLGSLDLGLAVIVDNGRLKNFGFTSFTYKLGDISIVNKGGITLNTSTEILTLGAGISINTLSGNEGNTAINNLNFDGNLKVNLITGELSGKINSLTLSNGYLVNGGFKAYSQDNSEFSIKGLNLDIATIMDLGRGATTDEIGAKLFSGTTDTVSAYVDIGMVAGLEIANCLGTSGISVTGNKLNNKITGNAGANIIDGGAGADSMIGGLGSDTYYVDNYKDIVVEQKDQGIDIVYSDIGYTLPQYVENLYLGNYSIAVQGAGNVSDNIIIGNEYRNVLYGAGGSDTLDGVGNSDVYIIKSIAELGTSYKIIDTGSSGTDVVRWNGTDKSTLTVHGTNITGPSFSGIEEVDIGIGSSIIPTDPTNAVNANVNASAYSENGLKIQGNYGNNSITGTDQGDFLYGLKGNDVLIGGKGSDNLFGGAGNDTLTGGADADGFIFDMAPNKTNNLDTITDFQSGADKIFLSRSVFKGIGSSPNLVNEAFYAAAGAIVGHDANDRIIYNSTTGALFYDADGNGSGAAVQIAIIGSTSSPLPLLYTDFVVY